MQTQCSFSSRADWQIQTFVCENKSWAPNRMGVLASGLPNQSYPTSSLGDIHVEMARMQHSILEMEKQAVTKYRP